MKDKNKAALSEGGFITSYLISGPRVVAFENDKSDPDQLRYEKYLRSIIAQKCDDGLQKCDEISQEEIKLGAISELGMPWEYHCSLGNWFVDHSDFYSLLKKIDLVATVQLIALEELELPACLWTYGAVDLWLNGEHICFAQEPVYKPIRRIPLDFKLKKGKNQLYVRFQNLGVRDTRNIFGIQLLGDTNQVEISLPDARHTEQFDKLSSWLSGIKLSDHTLEFGTPAPCEACLLIDTRNPDLTKKEQRYREIDITGKSFVELPAAEPYVLVQGQIDGRVLSRRLELIQEIKPKYSPENVSIEDNLEMAYQRIAGITQMDRGEDVGFSMNNLLARAHLKYGRGRGSSSGGSGESGVSLERELGCGSGSELAGESEREHEHEHEVGLGCGSGSGLEHELVHGSVLEREPGQGLSKLDVQLFMETLSQIESRIDCSDFLMCGLLRYVHNYPLDKKQLARVREVVLNYRFWMDQKGSDGMCFWSENHALMFYSCAMIAGKLFPAEYFTRAEKTGKELFEAGSTSVGQWLCDIEKDGFEEFLSAGYLCVTFGALLNVVDFGPEHLSEKAVALVDRLLYELSLHTFHGVVIAPQGRVYRDVVYPFAQGVQALINMVDPTAPYCLDEWLIFMATSKYKIPKGLTELMRMPIKKEYCTGNALIHLHKTNHYTMTSVQSPRQDGRPSVWNNISFVDGADKSSYLYVKSMNERYHGTTQFEPGVYGYQQHMWYAALDIDTVVFANHPGGTFDGSSMRPGYWYGNSIMPAVQQLGNILGAIYVIPEKDPIHFTHLHWKSIMFEKTMEGRGWLFGEKNGAYIGVWCSVPLHVTDDMMFQAEYRAYSDTTAYLCHCSAKDEISGFDAFIAACYRIHPCFDKETLTLSCEDRFSLHYEQHENPTQFI